MPILALLTGPRYPYTARQSGSSQKWGVWDRMNHEWLEGPSWSRLTAERMSILVTVAYAAGSADTVITEAR
jgi:hypothetical protein